MNKEENKITEVEVSNVTQPKIEEDVVVVTEQADNEPVVDETPVTELGRGLREKKPPTLQFLDDDDSVNETEKSSLDLVEENHFHTEQAEACQDTLAEDREDMNEEENKITEVEVSNVTQPEIEEDVVVVTEQADNEPVVDETPVTELGRGLREKKPPTRLQDYILNTVLRNEDRAGGYQSHYPPPGYPSAPPPPGYPPPHHEGYPPPQPHGYPPYPPPRPYEGGYQGYFAGNYPPPPPPPPPQQCNHYQHDHHHYQDSNSDGSSFLRGCKFVRIDPYILCSVDLLRKVLGICDRV
ncbi:hypothetical protein F2Q69_00061894 [Brassica cretica]|uniref:Uncharacterized protein n=1 Tax=Brassica cretica TaxID=69181 RepID=A0A8S9RDR4_BRACR|nr:hypothetical protein F2Q69_00061894 [Brassica cretica]